MFMENYKMPIGLGMALAQRPEAMEKFATLSESKKLEIIDGTHSVSSKEEMQKYVDRIILMNDDKKQDSQKSATDNKWISTGIVRPSDKSERKDGPGGES